VPRDLAVVLLSTGSEVLCMVVMFSPRLRIDLAAAVIGAVVLAPTLALALAAVAVVCETMALVLAVVMALVVVEDLAAVSSRWNLSMWVLR